MLQEGPEQHRPISGCSLQPAPLVRFSGDVTVLEPLPHSLVSLTLNTYSHVLPALQREAAAKIDAVLSGS